MPTSDTERSAWLSLVLAEYHRVLASHDGLRALQPANFEISEELTWALGQWDPGRRTITLSARLLDGRHWHVLVHVLKHELAHQIVDELAGARHQRPHGAAFADACALLGIPAGASLSPEALEVTDDGGDRVRARIVKLLALAQSDNRHEAELALARAHELGLRHNIELRDARPQAEGRYQYRLVGRPMRRIPSWTWSVTAILDAFYFVQYICRSYADPERPGSHLRVIELYGTRTNLDLAEYVYHYLVNQGAAEWRRYRAAEGLTNNRARLSFLKGLYRGFHERLRAEREALASTSRELVWVGDPDLDAFYRARNPRVRTTRARSRHHPDAHSAGRAVGRELTIKPGVGSDGAGVGVVGYLE